METATVNILGTEYKLTEGCDDKAADGWSKFYKKVIQIKPKDQMLDGEESDDEEKNARKKEVIRHELYHCFLYEGTGMDYAYDENLVNFLAVSAPKIFKTFQELDIL